MKKIKKWQVFFFGILIYLIGWSLVNPWYFEKKIDAKNYQAALEDTSWYWEEQGLEWRFNGDGSYFEFIIDENGERINSRLVGNWVLDQNKLEINGTILSGNGAYNGYSLKRINMITNNYLLTDTLSPGYGSGAYIPKEILKKIENE
jgi:hypothetical protein